MANSACPCCGASVLADGACASCGHRWRAPETDSLDRYYAGLQGRNAGRSAGDEQRRLDDRMATLAPLLRDGQRIIEWGCAEGGLGTLIKSRARVNYTGIEPSRDAHVAARVLDRALAALPDGEEGSYDLLLAFHVLEHIADVATEAARWRSLLTAGGLAVVEVPRGAGHPLLADDANPEHLHLFTAASLTALFARHGLEAQSVTSGHFESAVCPDALRITARPAPDEAQKRAGLLARFRARFPGPFAVYGLGGDFRNYVLPLLPELRVAALLDSNARRYGEQIGPHKVAAFDADRHRDLPVLVASLRFGGEIASQLAAAGVPRARIVGLAEIYGPTA